MLRNQYFSFFWAKKENSTSQGTSIIIAIEFSSYFTKILILTKYKNPTATNHMTWKLKKSEINFFNTFLCFVIHWPYSKEALLSSLLLSVLVILPKFYQSIYTSPSNAHLVAGEKNTCLDAFSRSCHLSIFIHLPWSSAVFPCYADVVPLAIVCRYSCLSTCNEMITIDFIILSLFFTFVFQVEKQNWLS